MGVGVQRLHAHVTDDRRLFALVPCYGWHLVGRFRAHQRFEDEIFALLRRAQDTEHDIIYANDIGSARVDLFFRCLDVYEAAGVPIPPLPE